MESLTCAILRVLVTTHAYGKPIPKEVVLSRAAFPSHRGGAAKEPLDGVRKLDFVYDHGSRGIQLDTGSFGQLVQYLHDVCGWERFELELRIKHFEGWDSIEWNGASP